MKSAHHQRRERRSNVVVLSTILVIWIYCSMLVVVDGANTRSVRRKLSEGTQQEDHRDVGFADTDCPTGAILHDHRGADHPAVHQILRYHDHFQQLYRAELKPGTLDTDNLFTETVPNGTFVFWELKSGDFELSLYNAETEVEGNYRIGHVGNNWKFVSPSFKDFGRHIRKVTMLPEGHYVAFVSLYFEQYQHLLIDHLGYIAYLRKTMPATTRFLLADTTAGTHQELIETIDPEFALRCEFIKCVNAHRCNQLFKVTEGPASSITAVTPMSNPRHAELLADAREWITEAYPKHQYQQQTTGSDNANDNVMQQQPADADHTIVYYSRRSSSAKAGREMDEEQEEKIIQLIQNLMGRFERTERFVVFDGRLSIREQIDLFRSAAVVIGAHGGGLANLLFTLPMGQGQSCDDRTKVVEFATSKATPLVQKGILASTYYKMFASAPWLEFHKIYFVAPSDSDTTFVDNIDLRDSLLVVLGGMAGHHAISTALQW
jgi:hypothetical protein